MKADKRQEQVAYIFDDLKKKIIRGQLKQNEKLSELVLCEIYSVSRLYIKEVLKMLDMEKLINYVPRRGYHIAGISMHLIKEMAAIRYAYDCIACEYFAKYASPDELAKLEKIADRMKFFGEHRREDDVLDEAVSFYDHVYSVCPFERITDTLKGISSYIDLIKKFDADEEGYFERGTYAIITLTNGIKEKDSEKIRHALYYRNHRVLDMIFGYGAEMIYK